MRALSTDMQEASLTYRPVIIRMIEERFGKGAAEPLLCAFGGQKIGIPSEPSGSKLEAAVGPQIAALLADYRGGEYLYIPNGGGQRASQIAELRRQIVADNPGESINSLAQRLGISERRVSQLRFDIANCSGKQFGMKVQGELGYI